MQASLHLEIERARKPGDVFRQCRAQNDRVTVDLLQRERPTGPAHPADALRRTDCPVAPELLKPF